MKWQSFCFNPFLIHALWNSKIQIRGLSCRKPLQVREHLANDWHLYSNWITLGIIQADAKVWWPWQPEHLSALSWEPCGSPSWLICKLIKETSWSLLHFKWAPLQQVFYKEESHSTKQRHFLSLACSFWRLELHTCSSFTLCPAQWCSSSGGHPHPPPTL